jgi:hypothetical protein
VNVSKFEYRNLTVIQPVSLFCLRKSKAIHLELMFVNTREKIPLFSAAAINSFADILP